MKIAKVSYSKTYHLGDHFFHKIGAEADLDDTDTPMDALAELKNVVEGFNDKTIMQSGFIGIIPTIQKNHVTKEEDDLEFETLKDMLQSFEFREDAQEYLDTTDFKYTVEAKSIIQKLKSKL